MWAAITLIARLVVCAQRGAGRFFQSEARNRVPFCLQKIEALKKFARISNCAHIDSYPDGYA